MSFTVDHHSARQIIFGYSKQKTMKPTTIILFAAVLVLFSCTSKEASTEADETKEEKSLVGYVELTNPLDESLIQEGTKIFTAKCARCHTLDTAQFTVPSFAGVTNRRSPEWIMNMIINVDEMLKQDPVAADLLRKHKKVMPDPNLKVSEARAVLEFLRKNDLEQVGENDGGVQP